MLGGEEPGCGAQQRFVALSEESCDGLGRLLRKDGAHVRHWERRGGVGALEAKHSRQYVCSGKRVEIQRGWSTGSKEGEWQKECQ